MREFILILMGFLGTLGFSLLFHVKGWKLLAIALGGAASTAIYLWVLALSDEKAMALLVSTTAIGILAEVFARCFKSPVISFLVPMLVPLIPGSDLYYATSFLIRGQSADFAARSELLLWQAGAIAFGIILAACVTHIPVMKIRKEKA